MTVRAKLVVTAITGQFIRFHAQDDESIPEDQRFQRAKAAPSGSAEFHIDNPAALEQFKVGAAYHVDFNPA